MKIVWKCQNEYSTLNIGDTVILKGSYNMLRGREQIVVVTVKNVTPTGKIRFKELKPLFECNIGHNMFPLKDPLVQETYEHLKLVDMCSDLIFEVFRDKQSFLNKASEEDLLKIKEVLEKYEEGNS